MTENLSGMKLTKKELVEALARRMAHVTHANPSASWLRESYPTSVYDQDWELYLDAARECLRQMEWIRHQCEEDQQYGMPAVTLAPPDWKPE